MATVGLLGMALTWVIDEEGLLEEQACVSGATETPRKDLARLIESSCNGVSVLDLGELTQDRATTPDHYKPLAFEAKRRINKSGVDVTLVIGGDHAAAFPLYNFDGKVVRVDAHGDAYVPQGEDVDRFILNGATYAFFVKKTGLKNAEDVLNVGLNVEALRTDCHNGGVFGETVTLEQVMQLGNDLRKGVLDIDLDVLPKAYDLPHRHTTSNLSPKDLAGLIVALKPTVIGIFNCVDRSGKILQHIVSGYQNVFAPICEAVGQLAIAKSQKTMTVSFDPYR